MGIVMIRVALLLNAVGICGDGRESVLKGCAKEFGIRIRKENRKNRLNGS